MVDTNAMKLFRNKRKDQKRRLKQIQGQSRDRIASPAARRPRPDNDKLRHMTQREIDRYR